MHKQINSVANGAPIQDHGSLQNVYQTIYNRDPHRKLQSASILTHLVIIRICYRTYISTSFIVDSKSIFRMGKIVLVGLNGSPSHYTALATRYLADDGRVFVEAIEGAIVIAVDSANRVVRDKMGTIKSIKTTSLPVKSRVTGQLKPRTKIAIELVSTNTENDHSIKV